MKPRLAGQFETRLALQRSPGCSVMVAGAPCKRLATRAYTRGGMAYTACEACLVRLGAVRAPRVPPADGGAAVKPRKVRPVTPATEKHRLAAMAKLCELQGRALQGGALAVARLDVRTPNPLNGIGAGSRIALSRQRKKQRELAATALRYRLRGSGFLYGGFCSPRVLPCVVLVRRVAPSSGLDPHDSLPASLKSIVDGIADALGLASDRDERVRWTYDQRRGVPGEHAVEVEVWPMGNAVTVT